LRAVSRLTITWRDQLAGIAQHLQRFRHRAYKKINNKKQLNVIVATHTVQYCSPKRANCRRIAATGVKYIARIQKPGAPVYTQYQ